MLRVDGDEHLDDVIFRHAIENDRRHGERLVAEMIDVGVQREQAVLAVDGAQDAFAFRHLEASDPRSAFDRFETELLVARDDHRARD